METPTARAKQGPVRRLVRMDDDRLSSLPDDILSDILSRLPTKAAVRTAVLGRRWEHLWTRVSNLDLDNIDLGYRLETHCNCNTSRNTPGVQALQFLDRVISEMPRYTETQERKDLEFCRFVDRVLSEHKNLDSLKRFSLHFGVKYLNQKVRPNFWLKMELGSGSLLEEIDVKVDGDYETGTPFCMRWLPEILYNLKHLRVLNLDRVVMATGSSVFLPNVKILQLFRVTITDGESLSRLVSGCPVLETAHLETDLSTTMNDENYKLIATLPCLKSLTIVGLHCYALLEIEAPSVEHLDLKLVSAELRFPGSSKLSCLDSVSVQHCSENGDWWDHGLPEFLPQISNAKEMSLSWRSIAVIEFRDDFRLPVFPNLTHLRIEMDPNSCILLLFLNSASNLQSLVITLVQEWDKELEEQWDESTIWPSELAYKTPECPLSSLEEIEIKNYKGGLDEVEMVAYLLEIGVALKKLTVRVPNGDCELEELAPPLLKLPRGSPACEVLVTR